MKKNADRSRRPRTAPRADARGGRLHGDHPRRQRDHDRDPGRHDRGDDGPDDDRHRTAHRPADRDHDLARGHGPARQPDPVLRGHPPGEPEDHLAGLRQGDRARHARRRRLAARPLAGRRGRVHGAGLRREPPRLRVQLLHHRRARERPGRDQGALARERVPEDQGAGHGRQQRRHVRLARRQLRDPLGREGHLDQGGAQLRQGRPELRRLVHRGRQGHGRDPPDGEREGRVHPLGRGDLPLRTRATSS